MALPLFGERILKPKGQLQQALRHRLFFDLAQELFQFSAGMFQIDRLVAKFLVFLHFPLGDSAPRLDDPISARKLASCKTGLRTGITQFRIWRIAAIFQSRRYPLHSAEGSDFHPGWARVAHRATALDLAREPAWAEMA